MWDTTALDPLFFDGAQKLMELDGCPRFATAYLGRKRRGDPDFLHAAPIRFACAAFIKESRMKFANANKPHRKSGGSPYQSF
jgi:hypothetical protein